MKLADDFGKPLIQFIRIGILEAVLKLRAAHTALDGQVLHRLHVQRDPLHLCELRLKTTDNIARAKVSLVDWLQVDLNSPAIRRRVHFVDADKGRETFHCRIAQDDAGQRLLPFGHRRKGNGWLRLRDSKNDAGILDREETFGNDDIQQDRHQQCTDSNDKRCCLMIENPSQCSAVELDHPVKCTA